MTQPTLLNIIPTPHSEAPQSLKDSKSLLRETETGELVFAVVGHIGSGVSEVAEALKAALEKKHFDVYPIKARDEIIAWAKKRDKVAGGPEGTTAYVSSLQDWGDEMRRGDETAVAVALVRSIRKARAKALSAKITAGEALMPDKKPRAYVLDSIRHEAEAQLLREVYRAAFVLIGVVCDEEERIDRLNARYRDAGREAAIDLMKRDADADEDWGQHVEDVFHTADIFLDNTPPRFVGVGKERQENRSWMVPEELSRLVKIVIGTDVVRPTNHESAMYAAYGAKMSSACLSKQVGAALADGTGNVIATGTNEVPRAGGGVFAGFADGDGDHRCAHSNATYPFCANTREQKENIELVLNAIPELAALAPERILAIQKELLKSPLGQALEFSRAVHAEMDAILKAGRSGVSPVGGTLYTTTFPCHYCARHIVASGVHEVQYVEPYPKSKALKLHPDTITVSADGWKPPGVPGGKVLIRPFTGVAPRLYRRAFLKTRELKDRDTGLLKIGPHSWSHPWQIRNAGYPQLEAQLAEDLEKESAQE